MSCSRRKFLVQSGWLLAPVALASCGGLVSGLLSGCHPIKTIQGVSVNGVITVERSNLQEDGFVLLHANNQPAPIYLGRTGNDYSAVLMLCTHKACVLEPAGSYLTCPCHGSEFTGRGKLVKSPAATDLKSFPVTTDELHLYIHV